MKISISWLREIVECPWGPDELAEKLASAGLPVETIDRMREDLAPIVVGEVLETQKHPNADRLTLCRVNVGGAAPLSIVCGAANVRAGLRVAVGLVGTTLPNGLTLEARKIRGEASQGMICSGEELACEPTPAGIWELPAESPIGASLRSVLGFDDVVFDIEVPSNRGDCLSHIGVAREVAAWSGAKLALPAAYGAAHAATTGASGPDGGGTRGVEADAGGVRIAIEDAAGCPAYGAARLTGVRVGPSPAWLRARVERLGVRSLGNIVDATNLVLLECGHPIHAFDVARLRGPEIRVRRALAAEKLVTLDDKEHALAPSVLVIADRDGAVALAGIMGGKHSEVNAETTDVLIEAAYFDPAVVRAGSRLLRKTSEASLRFGRGVDIEAIAGVLERAITLIREVAGGELAGAARILRASPAAARAIAFAPAHARALLGADVSDDDAETFLIRAGCRIEGELPGDAPVSVTWSVQPPSYRRDLAEPVDLVEEIARHLGYDNIPSRETAVTRGAVRSEVEQVERLARDTLAGAGFFEARTLSLVDPAELARLRLDAAALVAVGNPLASDQSTLRPAILASLLAALRLNANRGTADVRLFEIGAVFRADTESAAKPGATTVSTPVVDADASAVAALRSHATGVIENRHLALVWSGLARPGAWDDAARFKKDAVAARADVFDMKGALESLAAALRVTGLRTAAPAAPRAICHAARQADIFLPGSAGSAGGAATPIGFLGEIDPDVAAAAELPERCIVAEIDFDRLVAARAPRALHRALPRFPAIRRDIALLLDDAHAEDRVRQVIAAAADARLESLALFDLYLGDAAHPLPAGKRSLAYSLVFRSAEGTLTDADADALRDAIVGALVRDLGAAIR
ncbi:MAG: phenylalanine--tRNA ligase subunit beta [bacterium]